MPVPGGQTREWTPLAWPTGVSSVSISPTGANGCLELPATGLGMVPIPKTSCWGDSVSEASEELSAIGVGP